MLFEVSADDLPAPLKQFQWKEFNKSGFREVCKLLGQRTGVEGDLLRHNFKVTWPTLDREVQNDLRNLKANQPNKRLQRTAPTRRR